MVHEKDSPILESIHPGQGIRQIVLLLCFLVSVSRAGIRAQTLTVFFVSVGQGDCEFVKLPSGKTVLIDGGPNSDSSESNPALKFLDEQGVKQLDYVVLTHPHSDHYNGLLAATQRYPISAFYDTRVDNARATGDDRLRTLVKEKGATIIYPHVGDTLDWDPTVSVQVLNAGPEEWISTADGKIINNASLTFRFNYGSSTYLFTGDAESDAEQSMLTRSSSIIRADILKVAHHGSRYTSTITFLQAVRPQFAIIEVGPNNYGHPMGETLSRLAEMEATVYRTDQSGTVVVETSGDRLYRVRHER